MPDPFSIADGLSRRDPDVQLDACGRLAVALRDPSVDAEPYVRAAIGALSRPFEDGKEHEIVDALLEALGPVRPRLSPELRRWLRSRAIAPELRERLRAWLAAGSRPGDAWADSRWLPYGDRFADWTGEIWFVTGSPAEVVEAEVDACVASVGVACRIADRAGPLAEALGEWSPAHGRMLVVPTRSPFAAVFGGRPALAGTRDHLRLALSPDDGESWGRASVEGSVGGRAWRVEVVHAEDGWVLSESGEPWPGAEPVGTSGPPHRRFDPARAHAVAVGIGLRPEDSAFYGSPAVRVERLHAPILTASAWELPVGPFPVECWDDGSLHVEDDRLHALVTALEVLRDPGPARRAVVAGRPWRGPVAIVPAADAPEAARAMRREAVVEPWIVADAGSSVVVSRLELLSALRAWLRRLE